MYSTRRKKFMEQMDGGVALFKAAPNNRGKYHPDSDFLFLTGFTEPNAGCLLTPEHKEHKFVLFVRPKDKTQETWTGRRAGVEGAKEQFDADEAYPIDKLDESLPKYLDDVEKIYYRMGQDEAFNQKIVSLLKRYHSHRRREDKGPNTIIDPSEILHEMRQIKAPEEISLMRKAAQITAKAHLAVMKTVKPGMYEYELEALFDYTCRKNGGVGPSYSTILASGPNATILHYNANNRQIQENDLILIDAATEYEYYDSDVTRTIPASGKFSDEQKAVYNIVLEAQLAAIEMVKPGNRYDDFNKKATQVITEGLVKLGLLAGKVDKLIEENEHRKFYMHNAGHWLGLDTHDVGKLKIDGKSRAFEPGMVITVEPGIYIDAETEGVPEKYRNIGIRIEDDVLVTKDGNDILTADIPKRIEDIERIMQ